MIILFFYSNAEQLSVMEYLARLLQRNQISQNTKPHVTKRCLGRAKGKFIYPEEFDEDNKEIAQLFEVISKEQS